MHTEITHSGKFLISDKTASSILQFEALIFLEKRWLTIGLYGQDETNNRLSEQAKHVVPL